MATKTRKSTTGTAHARHKTHAKSHRRVRHHHTNLEVYAFWTGFLSTIISLIQVMVMALK